MIKNMSRNVFILIDGTMCSSDTGSNIIRIQEVLEPNKKNEWLYSEGVASLSAAKWLQTAIPTELATEANNLYKMLALMDITEDDRLIIIGYSRGAILARILAQMITNDVAFRQVMGVSDKARKIVRRTTVDFLGLFDPVRGWPSLPAIGYDSEAQNNASIQNICEIVSLDERFIFFKSDSSISQKKRNINQHKVLHSLAQTRETSKDKETMGRSMVPASSRHFCLFPGVHSDVGGQQANIALSVSSTITMLSELTNTFPDLRTEFCGKKIEDLKASLINHPEIVVGGKTGFIRKILSRRRRLFPDENTTLHPLVDDISGRKNISKNLKLSRWRKYSVLEEYRNCPKYDLHDL